MGIVIINPNNGEWLATYPGTLLRWLDLLDKVFPNGHSLADRQELLLCMKEQGFEI